MIRVRFPETEIFLRLPPTPMEPEQITIQLPTILAKVHAAQQAASRPLLHPPPPNVLRTTAARRSYEEAAP